jgi:chemotaxis protein MotB
MARKKHRHEEHQNHEAWAIPYGDLVTLLLAFFVVMYAMSSVNAGKYRVLSNALNAAFRGTPTTPELVPIGSQQATLEEQLPAASVAQLFNAGVPVQRSVHGPQAGDGSKERDTKLALAAAQAEAAKAKELANVAADVTGVLGELIKSNQVHVQLRRDAVEVQIGADMLFASGMADPSPAAIAVLQRLADALRPWPNAIRVEGHTDDVQIRGGMFRSNWELSGARAGSVARLLTEHGIEPTRVQLAGYGEFRPLQVNTTAEGRNANRRVELLVLGRTPGNVAADP